MLLIHQTQLFVGALGTWVQRGRQTVADHLRRIKVCKCWVQATEVVQVGQNRLSNHISYIVRYIRRCHECCANTECCRVGIVASIHAARDGRDAVVWVVSQQDHRLHHL